MLCHAADGASNLTRFDKWNASTSMVETVRYVINGANQITCIDADVSGTCNGSETVWQYDAFGNLLNDGTKAYVYDTANRLSSVTVASSTTTYQYDGDGNRISQTIDSVTTTYVLDIATPLTMVLSETTGSTTIRYWHGLDLIAQSDGTATTYLGYDGLGSVRQLTDPVGAVQLAQTFDPYGTLYSDAGTNSTRFAFTGEYQDGNGLLYLRARYYNAGSGRFTQMDPSRQERNAYQYSYNNPLNYTDPSGLLGGMVAIPYVDEGNGYLVDIHDWYGWKSGNEQVLSASARRTEAVRQAKKWADDDTGSLPWGVTGGSKLTESDASKQCNDCVMFVSYILWRVGFRMKGIGINDGIPSFFKDSQNHVLGWGAANVVNNPKNSIRYNGSTDAWRRTAAFAAWWTNSHSIYGYEENNPRATLTICKTKLQCFNKIKTLQIGDVILYDYSSSDHTGDVGVPHEYDFNHAAMVIENNAGKVKVASRGGNVCTIDPVTQECAVPMTRDCTGGFSQIDYLDTGETAGNVFGYGLLRVGLMHINYEGYMPKDNK